MRDPVLGNRPSIEGVDRADAAGDRGARVAEGVLLGEEPAEGCVIRLLERRPGALEEGRQLQQIPPVGRHGVRREVALQPEVVGERRARGGVADGGRASCCHGSSPDAPGEWSAQTGRIVPAPGPRAITRTGVRRRPVPRPSSAPVEEPIALKVRSNRPPTPRTRPRSSRPIKTREGVGDRHPRTPATARRQHRSAPAPQGPCARPAGSPRADSPVPPGGSIEPEVVEEVGGSADHDRRRRGSGRAASRRAGSSPAREPRRHRGPRSTRVFGRDPRAAASPRPRRRPRRGDSAAISRFRAGNRNGSAGTPGGYSLTTVPDARDPLEQAPVARGVRHVDPGAEHRDRRHRRRRAPHDGRRRRSRPHHRSRSTTPAAASPRASSAATSTPVRSGVASRRPRPGGRPRPRTRPRGEDADRRIREPEERGAVLGVSRRGEACARPRRDVRRTWPTSAFARNARSLSDPAAPARIAARASRGASRSPDAARGERAA